MTNNDIEKLRFRRQYLITPYQIKCPFQCKHLAITENINLYAHVDLNLTFTLRANKSLILLGDLFDYRNSQYNNELIINKLLTLSLSDLLVELSEFCGRYVIIICESEHIYLISDAAASRKIYYHRHINGTFCASQPHLIARILNFEPSRERSKVDFYSSNEFKRLNNSNIGNTTCYDDVFQVIPNHCIELTQCKIFRFWPNRKIETLPFEEVVNKCASMLKGYINSISHRYSVMLPVTAGKDSRLLLSATKDISNQVFYYLVKGNKLKDNHHDIVIPDRLFKRLGFKFHILHPKSDIDPDFERVYFENNRNGLHSYLPTIYNYYISFNDKVNLPGIFAETFIDYFQMNGKITPYSIAKTIGVERFDYAIKYYTEWLNGCESICKVNNISVNNLLYWEERMPNWGTQIQLDKDIAQDEILPFNSRGLIETLLSVPIEMRIKPDYKLHMELTRKLWPETISEPYNSNFKQKILKLTKKLGIIKPFKSVYYTILNGVRILKSH